jgi:DNA-binding SARP family transcriptional activator
MDWQAVRVAVQVGLAGPARLVVDRTVVDGRGMGGAVPQRVLAVLALAHGPVSRDELGDAVWGDALPRTWETALRGAVSKLRRAVAHLDPGAADLVRTAFGAYQLDPHVSVDVLEAERSLDHADLSLASHCSPDSTASGSTANGSGSCPCAPGRSSP